MGAGPLVVTYPLTGRSRAIVEEELGGTAEVIYLVDLAPAARAHALRRAGAVLSHDTSKELRPNDCGPAAKAGRTMVHPMRIRGSQACPRQLRPHREAASPRTH
jgi:hypothetical protein